MYNVLVSILIPVYNRENLIEETVNSALQQTYRNIEVIIVDNRSTDRTWEILNELAIFDARIKIFQNKTNIGPVKNWKRCIDEANGEYGKILWSDDLISPDFLEKTMPLLDSDVGFVYTGVKSFTDVLTEGTSNYIIGDTGTYPSEKYINYALYEKGVPVSPGCAIFRLSDLSENLMIDIPNKLNSNFSMHAIGNDLLIFLKIANNYRKFGFIAEELSFFRDHEGSISSSSKTDAGKWNLHLHYTIVKAYYVENYFKKEKRNFTGFIHILLWKYRKSRRYNINDFFKNPIKINYLLLTILLLKHILFILIKKITYQLKARK